MHPARSVQVRALACIRGMARLTAVAPGFSEKVWTAKGAAIPSTRMADAKRMLHYTSGRNPKRILKVDRSPIAIGGSSLRQHHAAGELTRQNVIRVEARLVLVVFCQRFLT